MSFLGQSYNAQATNPSVIMLAIMMLPDIAGRWRRPEPRDRMINLRLNDTVKYFEHVLNVGEPPLRRRHLLHHLPFVTPSARAPPRLTRPTNLVWLWQQDIVVASCAIRILETGAVRTLHDCITRTATFCVASHPCIRRPLHPKVHLTAPLVTLVNRVTLTTGMPRCHVTRSTKVAIFDIVRQRHGGRSARNKMQIRWLEPSRPREACHGVV
jgi:hypothetical protein